MRRKGGTFRRVCEVGCVNDGPTSKMSVGVPSLAFLLGRGCGDFVFSAQGERICKGYIVTKSRAHGRSAHARAKLKDVR